MVHNLRAEYLVGAIQVAPEQMGKSDTLILYSRNEFTYQRCAPLLKTLGENIVYLDDEIGAVPALDLATLSCLYGTLLGFFHGALICEKEGYQVKKYAYILAALFPSFGEFLSHEGAVIQSGDFRISQNPLNISVEASERLLKSAREARISTAFPVFVADVLKKAFLAGYGAEEVATVIKTMR